MRKEFSVLCGLTMAAAVGIGCNKNGGSSSSPVTNAVDRLTGPAATDPTPTPGVTCPTPPPAGSPTPTPIPTPTPTPPASLSFLLQVKSTSHTNSTYQKSASVEINGTAYGPLSISNAAPQAEQNVNLGVMNAGQSVAFNAVVGNTDGSATTSCARLLPVVSQNSFQCGPVEVFYDADGNSCTIVCN
jgi:hypothetical protein